MDDVINNCTYVKLHNSKNNPSKKVHNIFNNILYIFKD